MVGLCFVRPTRKARGTNSRRARPSAPRTFRTMRWIGAVGPVLTVLIACYAAAMAGTSAPFTARRGVELARDAARTWAPDAQLVYLENDEMVSIDGTAIRWGYLFYSSTAGKARGYSVRDGKILEAADLDFDFEAPPLPDEWIDSEQALTAAEKKAGQAYRREHGGRLSAMLLVRGAFDEEKPDASTWTLVYTSDTAPALFVVVDAAKGNVVRTWRG
jgi:hypothetical protein